MNPLSRKQMQQAAALRLKKYRDQSGLYQIGGVNTIEQSLSGKHLQIDKVIVEKGKESMLKVFNWPINTSFFSIHRRDFQRISAEKSPQGILMIARRPATLVENLDHLKSSALYLHQVNDPGNLGTIIRTALWYGIEHILLSPESADPFQPKTVRAAAGAITHINLYENVDTAGIKLLEKNGTILIGTKADGGKSAEAIAQKVEMNWLLMMGSEAHGLSPDILELCQHTVTLPRFGKGESLNLAVSTGICLHLLKASLKNRSKR